MEYFFSPAGYFVEEGGPQNMSDVTITALPYTETSCGRTFTFGIKEAQTIAEYLVDRFIRAVFFKLVVNGHPVVIKRISGKNYIANNGTNLFGSAAMLLNIQAPGIVAPDYTLINVSNKIIRVPLYSFDPSGHSEGLYGGIDFSVNICESNFGINDKTYDDSIVSTIEAGTTFNETVGPVFVDALPCVFQLFDFEISDPEDFGSKAVSPAKSNLTGSTTQVNVTNPETSPVNVQNIIGGFPVSQNNSVPVNLFHLSGVPVESADPLPVYQGPAIGANGNAWNAVAVAAAGVSATVDTLGNPNISVYGSVSAATTVSVNVSADNATWWPSTQQAVLNAAGDFYLNFTSGARYIQLTSSAAATITATVSAK